MENENTFTEEEAVEQKIKDFVESFDSNFKDNTAEILTEQFNNFIENKDIDIKSSEDLDKAFESFKNEDIEVNLTSNVDGEYYIATDNVGTMTDVASLENVGFWFEENWADQVLSEEAVQFKNGELDIEKEFNVSYNSESYTLASNEDGDQFLVKESGEDITVTEVDNVEAAYIKDLDSYDAHSILEMNDIVDGTNEAVNELKDIAEKAIEQKINDYVPELEDREYTWEDLESEKHHASVIAEDQLSEAKYEREQYMLDEGYGFIPDNNEVILDGAEQAYNDSMAESHEQYSKIKMNIEAIEDKILNQVYDKAYEEALDNHLDNVMESTLNKMVDEIGDRIPADKIADRINQDFGENAISEDQVSHLVQVNKDIETDKENYHNSMNENITESFSIETDESRSEYAKQQEILASKEVTQEQAVEQNVSNEREVVVTA